MALEPDYPPVSPLATGLAGRCPRCGNGRLFKGFIDLAPSCEACGLDYGFADSGDGPAVFVTLIAGAVVVGLALWTEVTYDPPLWVTFGIFLPLTLVVCLGILRPLKGVMIGLQYRNKAEQGHFEVVMPALPAETRGAKRASLVGPTIAALIAVSILVSLGVWQMRRLAWKTALLATIAERTTAPPIPVPPEADWASLKPEAYAYRHVTAQGTFDHTKEARVFRPLEDARGPYHGLGYLILTPLRLASGGTVIVNRGFVPENRADASTRAAGQIAGPVTITGLMREPESRNPFTPADDPKQGLWFTRDPQSIAAAYGLERVAPFTIDADASAVPGGLPQGGETVLSIPNDHLSYALTWFGLAIGLAVVYVAYVWRVRHAIP